LHDQIVDWWMAWWACESHGSYEMKVWIHFLWSLDAPT
jgi:hypothetical protein